MSYEKQIQREPGFLERIGLIGALLDVRWEPSPREVVEEMIRMASVGRGDVVYDLGCGDGRAVITAAKSIGARGVGIDLDPIRIKESWENASFDQVGHLVRFTKADLFKSEIGEATVLFIFLFPDVNLRLRPKLLSDLRPGTRVVSYCHHMERWLPDHCVRMRSNYLYLWVVPANMSGRWEGTVEPDGRAPDIQLDLEQEFQKVSGRVSLDGKVFFVRSAPIDGDRFRFAGLDGPAGDMALSGSVRGDEIKGMVRDGAFPDHVRTWTARRKGQTLVSLAR
jgi:SAM-dependent methyltransferase